MVTETRVWPDTAIPPGELLAETLETLGISQAELARRAGRPAQAINEIIRGTKEIMPETALQFERILGVPAHIWTRLEADYRCTKARLEDEERLRAEIPLAKKYPYAAMAKYGWVAPVRDALERVKELLRFFAVASLRQVPAAEAAAFRRSRHVNWSPEALAAWLRQGEREAQEAVTRPFHERALRSALAEVRSLTQLDPGEFEARLERLLADHGVALVLVPHLPRTGAHGATRWLGSDKAVVQMSIRYKWDDVFWFSLFHELGHVLLHGRGEVFIESDGDEEEPEREADAFGRDTLIPPAAYAAFVRAGDFSQAAIQAFARAQGIAPSIVVGRLHHEARLRHSHYLNDLRSRFVWANEQ